MIEKWWQHVFFSVYLFCCHHPLKSPVHRSFKGMGGSSGSTFAKLQKGGKIAVFLVELF